MKRIVFILLVGFSLALAQVGVAASGVVLYPGASLKAQCDSGYGSVSSAGLFTERGRRLHYQGQTAYGAAFTLGRHQAFVKQDAPTLRSVSNDGSRIVFYRNDC